MARSALAVKLRPLVEEIVEEKLNEILGDPDSGLRLRPEVRRELRRRMKNRVKPVPIAAAAASLGLKW